MRPSQTLEAQPIYKIGNDKQSISLNETHPSLMKSSRAAGRPKFQFDAVFDEHDSTSKLYNTTVKDTIQSFIEGHNTTLLAYGSTGSGKTHTMSGTSVDPGER